MWTDHAEPVLVNESRGGKAGDDAGDHCKVGVEDGPVLSLSLGEGAVEARPKHPEDDSTYSQT